MWCRLWRVLRSTLRADSPEWGNSLPRSLKGIPPCLGSTPVLSQDFRFTNAEMLPAMTCLSRVMWSPVKEDATVLCYLQGQWVGPVRAAGWFSGSHIKAKDVKVLLFYTFFCFLELNVLWFLMKLIVKERQGVLRQWAAEGRSQRTCQEKWK